eukprot:Skav216793  [mRNA]  locus=scaffold1384:200898:203707:+ [translate_table: standard]
MLWMLLMVILDGPWLYQLNIIRHQRFGHESCARDNFPIFFRRGKMPMGAYKVEGPQAQARKKNEFTRRYFINELGEELDPRVDVRLPERADFVKLFRHEGKVLRFKAKFANPKPEETRRGVQELLVASCGLRYDPAIEIYSGSDEMCFLHPVGLDTCWEVLYSGIIMTFWRLPKSSSLIDGTGT